MAHYTHLTKKQITGLAATFGLPPPSGVRPVLEGTVNTYYLLQYPKKSCFLKIDEVGNLWRLNEELDILKALRTGRDKLGFHTPIPIPAKSGKLFIPFRNKFVLLFGKIDGQSFRAGHLDSGRLKKIGAALGRMHQAFRRVSLPAHRFHFPELKRVYGEIGEKLSAKHPAVNLEVKSWLSWLNLNRPGGVPEGLIHADLFPENILFEGNKLSGILDFEAAGGGPFLFDIAVSLHACAINPWGLSVKKGRALMAGYQSVRRLASVEKKYFEYYLYESALRFLLTRLRDFELKDGPIKAKPFKDYREFVRRFSEIPGYAKKIL